MVRSFFGSPSGSSSSSKPSRKERIEQAKQAAASEKSRRRNFGFLNTGDKRMSTSTLSRTREHAKQLAMAYNDPVSEQTSMFSQQPMMGFQDDAPFDPFGTLTTTKPAPKANLQQTRAAGSFLDQHFEREFTASTQESFETASVGSAYDMDFLPSSSRNHHTTPKKTKKRSQKTTLDQFVESDVRSPKSAGGSLGLESGNRSKGERSVISMPTFPSNSSMQSSFARQSSSNSGNNNNNSGAAARRRIRNQMRQHSSGSSVSSTASETSSFCSTPPESPSSSVRNNQRNRVAAYQRGAAGSFHSQTSSTNNSQSNGSGSDNIFDSSNNGGFTFDAFGLDQSQVEREVNEAMQDLAGQGMSGFSMFLNAEIDEDFAPDNWDSPMNSRQSSPAPFEEEGFVDGFRITKQTSSSQSSLPDVSPAASERSQHSVPRRVRSQSKGAAPRWGSHIADRHDQPQPTIFDEPVNPWKEDPWGSDPEDKDFQSDTGNDSDFGTSKSEVLQSSIQPVQRYSESKSDVGIQSNQFHKSVSFHANVRLPQENFGDENDDNASHIHDHQAQEFAEKFVARISPSNNKRGGSRRAVDYGYQEYDYNNSIEHETRRNADNHERTTYSSTRYPAEQTSFSDKARSFQEEDHHYPSYDNDAFDSQEEQFEPDFGAFGAASDTEPQFSGYGAQSAALQFQDQTKYTNEVENFSPDFGAFGAASAEEYHSYGHGAHNASSQFEDRIHDNMNEHDFQPNFGEFEPHSFGSGDQSRNSQAEDQMNNESSGYDFQTDFGDSSSGPYGSHFNRSVPQQAKFENYSNFSQPKHTHLSHEQGSDEYDNHTPQRFSQNEDFNKYDQVGATLSASSVEDSYDGSTDYGPVRSNHRSHVASKQDVTTKSKFASFRSKYESSRESNPPNDEYGLAAKDNMAPNDYGPARNERAPKISTYRSTQPSVAQDYHAKQQPTYHPQPHVDAISPSNEESEISNEEDGTLPEHGQFDSVASRPAYGNFRNSYNVAKSKLANKSEVSESKSVSFGHNNVQALSNENFSTNERRDGGDASNIPEAEKQVQSSNSFERPERSEEKKDDEDHSNKNGGGIGSLKAKWRKWEAKSTATSSPKPTVAAKSVSVRLESSIRSGSADIGNSLGVEILTPDIVEARRQEKRRLRNEELRRTSQENLPSPSSLKRTNMDKPISASEERLHECVDQRNSFASLRERLKPSSTRQDMKSKSESGAGYRAGLASTVVDRLKRESPTNRSSGSSLGSRDTQSDTGSTPSFLANVKLRKTSSTKQLDTEPTNDSADLRRSPISQNLDDGGSDHQMSSPRGLSRPVEADTPKRAEAEPPKKKLTYRERRELELKRQQEEKSKAEATKEKEPKKDVAALIRRRIAANKQKTPGNNTSEDYGQTEASELRGRLKPVGRDHSSPMSSPSASNSGNTVSPSPGQSGLNPASPRFFNSRDDGDLSSDSTRFRGAVTSPRNNGSDDSRRFSSPRNHDIEADASGVSQVQFSSKAAPFQLSTNLYEEEVNDQMLHKVLSPSSVGTEMEYSTDNSHSNASNGPFSQNTDKGPATSNAANAIAKRFKEQLQPGAVESSIQSPRNEKAQSPAHADVLSPSRTKVLSPARPELISPRAGAEAQTIGVESAAKEAPEKHDVKAMLSNFLGARLPTPSLPAPTKEDDVQALLRSKIKTTETKTGSPEKGEESSEPPPPPPPAVATAGGRPALKDDPKYERYFRMLKVGMPMEVVKHAMQKDGNDPSVMDGDHDKPVGLPLKEDPKYTKYFKMLKLGVSMDQVKHSMQMDGLMPEVMDQDHNLPAVSCEQRSKKEPKEKPTHRRARLHWKTHQKVQRNSVWAKLEQDDEINQLDIDEEEFNELFQADLKAAPKSPSASLGANRKKGAAVRVIDAKRANNGGIILARVKMTHDEMADAVDRIDGDALSTEQIQNIIEFLPTKDERTQLEKYMLEGDEDAAEKFDGLCECEKFMVSMMTVKHAKRKVRALLFKLQFYSCLESIAEDARAVDAACEELRNSNRLRQLLGIVLQFGNRLNTAGAVTKRKAGAFSLDSLLKLNQAKAFDKKTTFLHYIVLIVQRNNDLLLNFSDDLPTVFKADKIYWDQCLSDLEEVENQLENVRRISLHEARSRKQKLQTRNQGSDDDSLGDMDMTLEEEVEALRSTRTGLFTLSAIKQVSALRDQVEVTGKKFMKLLTYFGEDEKKMQPHELFNIFSVFCRDFGKAKEDVFTNVKKRLREERKKTRNQAPQGKNGKPPAGPDRSSRPLKASSFQPNMSKVLKDFQNSAQDQQPKPQRPKPTEKNRHEGIQNQMDADNYNAKNTLVPNKHEVERVSHGALSSQRNLNEMPVQNAPGPVVSKGPMHLSMNEPSLRVDPRTDVPEEPVPKGMQESGKFEELAVPVHVPLNPRPKPSSVPAHRADFARDSIRQKARRQMQVVNGRATPVTSNTSVNNQHSTNRTSPVDPYRASELSQSRPPSAQYSNVSATPPLSSAPTKLSSRHMMRHRRRMEAQRQTSTSSSSRTAAANLAAN